MTDRKFPTGKVMGFDLSSGPDHSAAATFRVKGGEWTLEDLERISPHATRLSEEFMRREAEARARAQEEQIFRAMYGIPFGATIGIVIWLTSRNIEVAIWAAIGATLIWVADAVADR